MKRLSDYEGEEAIDLWVDLLDPMIQIVGDKKIAGMLRAKKPIILTAKEIIKEYKAEAEQILLRIDPTPLNGLNLLIRMVELLTEIGKDETIQSFFGSSADAKKLKSETSSSSAMENIEDTETSNTSSDM